MDKQKEITNRLGCTALVFLLIYISSMIGLSLIPGANLQDTIIPTYSVVLHFLEFFVLAFLAAMTFSLFNIKYFFSSLTSLIIFMSGLTEGIQYFVPGRVFSGADFIVNIFGGLTLILLMLLGAIVSARTEAPL